MDSVLDCDFDELPSRLEVLKEVNLMAWDEIIENYSKPYIRR